MTINKIIGITNSMLEMGIINPVLEMKRAGNNRAIINRITVF